MYVFNMLCYGKVFIAFSGVLCGGCQCSQLVTR